MVASKCLLDAIGDETQRVVLVSSLGVYGTSFLKPGSLVDEKTELDPHPERRNVYFHAKIWQERLFRERAEKGGIDLVVLRPGVLYGKDNPSHGLPSRVGIAVGKLHVALGAGSRLPLSHVTNCAEAVVLAGRSTEASGHSYNVLDDDLPTAREYLRAYKLGVEDVSILRLSFPAAMLLSNVVEKYRSKTGGQIPALLTPYQTSAMNKGHRFDNRRIKSLGWKQIVTTEEAMRETFAYLRARLNDTTPIKRQRQVVAVKSDILVRP